ncbi:MAG: hypothetical protein JXB26_17850 [Candidatus Aminicenantes bacterium]|nr:hypothetical protein [Candidatus Aminicenantes bacterium]
MFNKEFREVGKQSLFFSLFILFCPAVLSLLPLMSGMSYADFLFPTLQFGLFFWALFMGTSLFSSDKAQGGMEYLLSLPYSRLKIIGIKVLPRLASVFLFFLVYLLLYLNTPDAAVAVPFFVFMPVFFCLFVLGLSLSAGSDNLILLALGTFLLFALHQILATLSVWGGAAVKGLRLQWLNLTPFITETYDVFDWTAVGVVLFVTGLLLIPFLVSFLLSFRKYDIRPAGRYNRRYTGFLAISLLPILALSFLTSAFFLDVEWSDIDYRLTGEQKLIEATPYYLKIHTKDKVLKADRACPSFFQGFLIDEGRYIYDSFAVFDQNAGGIMRLDTSTGKVDVLLRVSYKSWGYWNAYKYGSKIALLSRDAAVLKVIDENTKDVKAIHFRHGYAKKLCHIFGTGLSQGRRFWLIRFWMKKSTVLRLWEEGGVEEIAVSTAIPAYINDILFIHDESTTKLLREEDGRFEVVAVLETVLRGLWIYGLTTEFEPLREMYGISGEKILRLDLETFKLDEVLPTEKEKYYSVVFFRPGHFYLEERDRKNKTFSVYRLEGKEAEFIRTFPEADSENYLHRIILTKGGILVRRGKKIKAYGFPGLNELKFKGL